jgi:hypothetical protein
MMAMLPWATVEKTGVSEVNDGRDKESLKARP